VSPTTGEAVSNKALSGLELREVIRADVERLLDAEGLLSHYLAYGRISYDITLRLHLDNPMQRESSTTISSKPHVDSPMEMPPLAHPSDKAVASGVNVHRDITSPNAERLRHELPLPVTVRGQDGTVQTEMVKYPPQPDLGEGEVKITDTTCDVRAAWKTTESS
jgi:hypothetical protein